VSFPGVQFDWSEELPVSNITKRNVENITRYRESTPVHHLFSEIADALGVGIGSLRNLYIARGFKKPFLIAVDPHARGCVHPEVARHIGSALDVPTLEVNFSRYTKESFLENLFTTDTSLTQSGHPCLPRYKEGEPLLSCRNLRTQGPERNMSLKTFADYIMQERDRVTNFTPYASWKRDRQQQGETGGSPAHLCDETYKLLDNPGDAFHSTADFIDFHAKAINTDLLKVIDFDVILFHKQTCKPLLIAEVKHMGGGYWFVTKTTGDALQIPAGLVMYEKAEDNPLRLNVEGFGLAGGVWDNEFTAESFADFIKRILKTSRAGVR
jgi:hypothetical protein